jgi:hypothetical protein
MAVEKRGELPADLWRGAARFARWRQGRVLGERIPEALWDLAVALAARHGVSRTASVLAVDYYSLKKRCLPESGSPRLNGEAIASSAGFIELPPPASSTSSACIVEFEKASGAKLRMRFAGPGVPDLAALARDFWEAG